jgi:hypothetical protein
VQAAIDLKANIDSPIFTGTVTAPTFSGNLIGNAATATKLQSARTIAGVSFDGSANIAIPFANLSSKPTTLSGYGITDAATGINGYANNIYVNDTRSVTTTPDFINRGVRFDFKSNAVDGLSDGGSYYGQMTFRQYGSASDWTGGKSHQLGFTDNDNIWHRSGSTSWGSWNKLYHSGNFTNLNQLTTRNFSDLQNKPTTLSGYGITDALLASSYNAADVLAKIKTVDGAGSGLDADLLDSLHSTAFSQYFHYGTTTSNTG